jgi:hypothetical protein
MLYTMWLDAMKSLTSQGQGNILSFDGSMDGFDKTMRQMHQLSKAAATANGAASQAAESPHRASAGY